MVPAVQLGLSGGMGSIVDHIQDKLLHAWLREDRELHGWLAAARVSSLDDLLDVVHACQIVGSQAPQRMQESALIALVLPEVIDGHGCRVAGRVLLWQSPPRCSS